MSYVLETLGRGLLQHLSDVFATQLPTVAGDTESLLRRRLERSPQSLDLWLRLGTCQLRGLRLAQANLAFDQAIHLAPNSRAALLGQACVRDERGDSTAAVAWLERAQEADDADPAVAFALGLCHERLHQRGAAEKEYTRARALNPNLRNVHERLAALAVRAGDWQRAADSYTTLVSLDPGEISTQLLLATLELHAGDFDAAIEDFQRALLIEPVAEESLAETEELCAAGQVREAVLVMEELVEQYPGVPDFHLHLGDLYAQIGDEDKAVSAYQAALDYEPNYLEAQIKLGTHQIRQGQVAAAGRTFTHAVELSDRMLLAFVGLGVAQSAAQRHKEAEATFQLALGLEPNSRLLLSECARLFFAGQVSEQAAFEYADQMDHYAVWWEAARHHAQVLQQTPNDASVQYRFGVLMRQLGDVTQAREGLENAVAINPLYAKAWIKLGIIRQEADDPHGAAQAWQQAFLVSAEHAPRYHELALLFTHRSHFDLALERFESALGRSAKQMALSSNLANALQTVGLIDQAQATWNAFADMNAAIDPLWQRRDAYLKSQADADEDEPSEPAW